MKTALQVSNILAIQHDQEYQRLNMKDSIDRQDYPRLTYKEAFKLATLGGAKGKSTNLFY